MKYFSEIVNKSLLRDYLAPELSVDEDDQPCPCPPC